jgi:hypothetical protein
MERPDRRRSPRRSVSWPISLSAESKDLAKGQTENVSRSGAYFLTADDGTIKPGMVVTVRIGVPITDKDRFVLQTISGEAKVVRLSKESGGSGVALHFSEELDPFPEGEKKK